MVLLKAELAVSPRDLDFDAAQSQPSSAKKPRVAMLLWNSCTHDSRVIKEAETLARAGYDVRVFCLAQPGVPNVEERNGVTYMRFPRCRSLIKLLRAALRQSHATTPSSQPYTGVQTTASENPLQPTNRSFARRLVSAARSVVFKVYKTLGSPFGKPFRHARAYATLGAPAVAFRPAVVHAHDLLTLWAAAVVAERVQAKLVYDTHEYALNVSNPPRGMSRLQDWLHERHGIRKADAVITVSQSIAGRLKMDYRIRRPTVIYNAPASPHSSWTSDVRRDLGLASDLKLVVYVGGLARNRGIEHVVSALRFLEGFYLASIGPTNSDYEAKLREQAAREGTASRLRFLKPVPSEALIPYLRTADVGVIAYQNVCLNHEYCMPNKLFECALAGVPLAVSDLRDLRRFVTRNRIGVVMDETDSESIADAIKAVCNQQTVFRPNPERLMQLSRRYSWETQAQKLTKLYALVLQREFSPSPIRLAEAGS